MLRPPPRSTLFPYPTLFRSGHMADAYWRVAHRPAVTFTSCGPGSTNIPVAVASAMMDSSALLAITANIPSVQFNRGAFQETYRDRKSTRLNSSHDQISYAVF